MQKLQVYIIILILFAGIPTSSADEHPQAVGGTERDYYIRIELSQWDIVAYDLNLVEDLVLNGTPYNEALQEAKYNQRLIFSKDSTIHLQVFSLDVQHGVSIPQLGIQEVIDRRDYSVYTFPTYIDFDSPTEDTIYELSCHVYCGMGHSDMKFKFVFGDGSKEYGNIVFYSFIGLNVIIFILFLKKTILRGNNGGVKFGIGVPDQN